MEAAHRNDTRELFDIFKELRGRGTAKAKDGRKSVAANLEAEREAWKKHFQKVSEGRGVVNEAIWENIKKEFQKADWLESVPTGAEMDKAISQMKNLKAPGDDKITADLIKYGGQKLRAKIHQVVDRMWEKAAEAEEGMEAMDWPKKWKVGIVVPMWKRKGKMSDKNTWRGITLLSVGSKILARVVAARLSQWAEGGLHEAQCGFRRGRGVDDVL